MKFNTILRNGLATALSAGAVFGFVACSRDYTADYVYSISAQGSASTGSVINAFAVDYQTGILTQITGSTTGLSNPSAVVASPNGKFLYVIGGTQNSEIEAFGVGTDGKIYGLAGGTLNLAASGTYPTGAAIDSTGKFLYVTYTYQLGFGPVSVGPGGVSIYPINTSTGLPGTPTNINVGNNPIGIAVAAPVCTTTPAVSGNAACATSGSSSNNGTENVFVYVVDQENSAYSPGASPTVLGFAQNTTTGALTLLSGTAYNSTLKTYQGTNAGVTPSAIAIDPTGRFVYVTDKTTNRMFGYQIASTTSGNLTPLTSSPFTTGLYPVAITIDPRGKYVYTANYNSNTVSAYSLNAANGSLGGAAGSGNFTTSTGPTCVTIDPALGIYLYTSNFLDGSISGAKLSPETGQLNSVANTPFPTSTLPACVVAVANGSHASQTVVTP